MDYIDLNDLLGKVADELMRGYAFDGCSCALFKPEEGVLVNHYARLPARLHEMENTYRSFRFQPTESTIAGLAFVRQAPQIIDTETVAQQSQTIQDVFKRWGFTTFASWPVVLHGEHGEQRVLGVFSGFYENGRVGPEMAMEVATRLAGAAPAIDAALGQEQFEVLDPELAAQHQLLQALTESNLGTSLGAAADPLCSYVMQRFGFDMAAVVLPQDDGLQVCHSTFAAAHGVARAAWQAQAPLRFAKDVTDSVTAVVFVQNTRFMVDDVQHMAQGMFPVKDREYLNALQTVRSYLLLPLRRSGQPVGVLLLMSLAQPVVLGEGELSTLQLLADFLASRLPA